MGEAGYTSPCVPSSFAKGYQIEKLMTRDFKYPSIMIIVHGLHGLKDSVRIPGIMTPSCTLHGPGTFGSLL